PRRLRPTLRLRRRLPPRTRRRLARGLSRLRGRHADGPRAEGRPRRGSAHRQDRRHARPGLRPLHRARAQDRPRGRRRRTRCPRRAPRRQGAQRRPTRYPRLRPRRRAQRRHGPRAPPPSRSAPGQGGPRRNRGQPRRHAPLPDLETRPRPCKELRAHPRPAMTSAADPRAAEFESHRDLLTGVAYRMLGSVGDAEDIVQDAWLRWREAGDIASPRGWLVRVVTRLCLDRLKSARVRREHYFGTWLPEPLVEAHAVPAPDVETDDSVSIALLLVLEKLSPVERAGFLLHDVFGYDFAEIAGILGKSQPSCRKLVSRARERVRAERPRFAADRSAHRP